MNITTSRRIVVAGGFLSALFFITSIFAGETNFYYAGAEGEPPSTTWPAIWTDVGGGTATAPVLNGLYTLLYNGSQIDESTPRGHPRPVREQQRHQPAGFSWGFPHSELRYPMDHETRRRRVGPGPNQPCWHHGRWRPGYRRTDFQLARRQRLRD